MSKQVEIETECETCSKPVPMPTDGTAFFWTPRGYEARPVYCAKCGERAKAPLVKPQPKTRNLGCGSWDAQL